MLNFLPGVIRGVLAFLLFVLNTVFWCTLLFIVSFLKLLIPFEACRKICNIILVRLASNWVLFNAANLKLLHRINWNVEGVEDLSLDKWYLVISNHQSWVDIVVLQTIFYRRIPFLKFFLKKELIWVPVLGLAWWALDFPFMKRYSSEFIKANPHLKGKDIEITRKACEKFKTIPVSVMNFVEGTRFTKEKHERQKSPHKYLLRPKAGGTAFVLAAMGEQLNSILNVTIVYPEGAQNFWAFLCGKITQINVRVETIPIDDNIVGDYFNDPEFQNNYRQWVNDLWVEKDKCINSLLG
ncbi:MAG: acyltransferase [Desulfobacterales bacterium]|jgi:1-acyl-sn-glycerol-3-phosphate acyltransferase|nr:acyltransferase [Desulfobacteraceae bacterium]MBT7087218.1 acyltransferase [Desulfobacterales bacterium]